ncbi:MAG: hypothetical protein ACFFBI_15600 [Promethearchaeota archaeon]
MNDTKFEELKEKIPEIFEKVIRDVLKITGRERSGLSLGLVEMGLYQGAFIGGMHFSPGTDIVMNKTPLKILLAQEPYETVWAYIYHVLLDLYLQTLSVLNEQQRRELILRITEEVFEEDHPAVILARNGIESFFPNLHFIYALPDLQSDGISIEYIPIDQESYEHYS